LIKTFVNKCQRFYTILAFAQSFIGFLVIWLDPYAVVTLARRTLITFVILLTLLAVLQNVGFNVTGLVAGLGIGGLAVALAAQKSLEHFFGGLSLVADQPIRVGDFCRFGDRTGTVEDIGLRSTRVRTVDRTLVTIPNAEFSCMQIENFSRSFVSRPATSFALASRAETVALAPGTETRPRASTLAASSTRTRRRTPRWRSTCCVLLPLSFRAGADLSVTGGGGGGRVLPGGRTVTVPRMLSEARCASQ